MSFENVIGQEKITRYLRHLLTNDRLASGYLFVGPEGVGKVLCALNLAKAINCSESLDFDSCDNCANCKRIDSNTHPDVHILEPEGSNYIKIESIRSMQKDINLRPFEGKKKVFIIKQVEYMTAESANAFLKILEEPPNSTIIILTTSNISRLFSTITSRCQKIFFGIPRRIELANMLKDSFGLDEQKSHFFGFFCEGRLGAALRYKDSQLFTEKNRLIDSLIQKHSHSLNEDVSLNQLKREDIPVYLDIMISFLRDIWIAKLGLDSSGMIHSDREKEIREISLGFKMEEIYNDMDIVLDSYKYLEQNINLKLLIEIISTKLQLFN